jgi:hypothetical protein
MPLRTRRSLTRGTPRGLFGSMGLMAIHSSSASSYPMIRAQFGSLNHRDPARRNAFGQARLDAYGVEADISQPTIPTETVENDPERILTSTRHGTPSMPAQRARSASALRAQARFEELDQHVPQGGRRPSEEGLDAGDRQVGLHRGRQRGLGRPGQPCVFGLRGCIDGARPLRIVCDLHGDLRQRDVAPRKVEGGGRAGRNAPVDNSRTRRSP